MSRHGGDVCARGAFSPVEIGEEEPRRVADGYFGEPVRFLLYESGNLVIHSRVGRPGVLSDDCILDVVVDEQEHFAAVSTCQVQ